MQKHKWKRQPPRIVQCPYMEHISCQEGSICQICGWYPKEHQRRAKQLSKYGRVTVKTREDIEQDYDDQRSSGLLE